MNKFMKSASVAVEVDREKKDKVRYVALQSIYPIFNRASVRRQILVKIYLSIFNFYHASVRHLY